MFIHFLVASVTSMDATPLNTFITIKGSHTNKRYMVSYKMTQTNSNFIPISYLTYKANRDTTQQLPAGLSKLKILVDQQKISWASNIIQNFSSQPGHCLKILWGPCQNLVLLAYQALLSFITGQACWNIKIKWLSNLEALLSQPSSHYKW